MKSFHLAKIENKNMKTSILYDIFNNDVFV